MRHAAGTKEYLTSTQVFVRVLERTIDFKKPATHRPTMLAGPGRAVTDCRPSD